MCLNSTSMSNATIVDRLTRLETLFLLLVQAVGVMKHVDNARTLVEQIEGPPDIILQVQQLLELMNNVKLDIVMETELGNNCSFFCWSRVLVASPR